MKDKNVDLDIPNVDLYSPELHEKLYNGMRLTKTIVNEVLKYTVDNYTFEIYVDTNGPILTISRRHVYNVTRIIRYGDNDFAIPTNWFGGMSGTSLTNEEIEIIHNMLTIEPTK